MTTLATRLAGGETVLSGWSSMPEPIAAEVLVRSGFPAVTLDMQHGQVDMAAAFRLIAAARLAGGRAAVRIPVGENQTASRMLDAGADMVIAPMIETVEHAEAFGATVKYPPVGERSWGPFRALQLDGRQPEDYRLGANRDTLAVAMIETRRALEAIDAILALPTIDGVFLGPADLSIALSGGAVLDVDSPDNLKAIARVAARAEAAGKFAGIFSVSPEHARRYRALGYRFLTVSSDIALLGAAAKAAAAAAGA